MPNKEWVEQNQDRMKKYRRDWYQRNKATEQAKARIRTKEYRKKHAPWLTEYKKTLKCESCGFSHPAALDFHHRNAAEKKFTISQWGRGTRRTKKEVLEEIEKCIVLCSNCHRIHHYEEKGL